MDKIFLKVWDFTGKYDLKMSNMDPRLCKFVQNLPTPRSQCMVPPPKI